MTAWIGVVLKLHYENIPLDNFHHGNPIPYCNWIHDAMGPNARWILVMEKSPNDIWHCHALLATLQRCDNATRSLKNAGKHLTNHSSHRVRPEILKGSSCKSGRSLLCYMLKNPEKVICTVGNDLMMCWNVRAQGLHLPYKHRHDQKHSIKEIKTQIKDQDPDTGNELTTWCLTHMMAKSRPLSLEELCRLDPSGTKRFLHRPNLKKIVDQCCVYYSATIACWSPLQITLGPLDISGNGSIHNYLLYQNIDPYTFDQDMYRWLWRLDPKKNTFVLQGPSNTGKSAFIRGLISAHGNAVGHICNGTFPFQGLAGTCNLGVWEEPLLSGTEAEKAKQIFGGEPTSIAVKFSAPVQVSRIPIIITSNHDIWRYCTQEQEPLSNRCFIYYCHNRINSSGIAESEGSLNQRCYCGCRTGSGDSPESSYISSPRSSGKSSPECARRRLFSSSSDSSSGGCRFLSGRHYRSSSPGSTKWSHYRITGSSIVRTEECEPNTSRHDCCPSTSASHDDRSCSTNRPSNPDHGISTRRRRAPAEYLDGYGKRRRGFSGNIGHYGSLGRLGGSLVGRRTDTGSAACLGGRPEESEQASELVANRELIDDFARSNLEGEQEVDRPAPTTLTIPTAEEWKKYCSYLHYRYHGHQQNI